MLLASLLATALAEQAPILIKARGPFPWTNPAQWVQTDDYPEAASREGRSGRTSVELLVDAQGVARHCFIRQSSGHADLDAASCRALLARAQFVPAVDARGRLRTGSYRRNVSWQLPDQGADLGLMADGEAPPGIIGVQGYMVTYIVQADGRITDCSVQSMSPDNSHLPPIPDCERLTREGQLPIMDAEGNPVARRMVYTTMALEADASMGESPPVPDPRGE